MVEAMLASADVSSAPFRKVRFWEPQLAVDRLADGNIHVRQIGELGGYPARLTDRLLHFAQTTPDVVFLADHLGGEAWRTVTYAEALERVRRIGEALLGLNLSPDRPIVVLSGNDIEHALLGLASQYVGIPYAAISTAYSLVASDHTKLKNIAALLTPGLVFAADGKPFGPAIVSAFAPDVPIATVRNPVPGRRNIAFAELEDTRPIGAADAANATVGPDTIAKFLFTSGSTGSPKAVINTQRMLCANQEMVRDCFAYMRDEPPIVVDWAPWNHTAGGNKVFNMVLYNGGSLYIDDGRPNPTDIRKTVRNLRDVAPTWYFNVPKGFEELVPHFEAEPELSRRFFSRLKMMMYAGAGLAQHTWSDLERLAVRATGERVLLVTGLGSTETAPFSMMCTVDQRIPGNIGLPARGITLKLVPADSKFEARLKGPNITPGYWRDEKLTAQAFDEEGYYRLGDALRFADPDDLSKGFYFDGRIGENFKLTSGTWVSVGALRARFIDHFAGLVRDVAIAGLDRDYIAGLVLPDVAACRAIAADLRDDMPLSELLADNRVRTAFAEKLREFSKTSTGSSTSIRRIILMHEPLSIDKGEVTDKGSINQRTVLAHHAALVDELYRGSPRVIAV